MITTEEPPVSASPKHPQTAKPRSDARWFERNPIKTLCALVFVLMVILLVGAEKILSHTALNKRPSIERFIRLREHAPLQNTEMYPTDFYMMSTDGLVQKPYRFRTDQSGFIMPSKVHENPDLTLVFFGGSTTECGFVEEEDRFPYLVGQLLEKNTGLKVNSYNSGVSGNTTLHDIDLLINKVLPLHPDVAVLMESINDMNVLLQVKNYWDIQNDRSVLIERTLEKPTLAKVIKETWFPELMGRWKQLVQQTWSPFIEKIQNLRGDMVDSFGKMYRSTNEGSGRFMRRLIDSLPFLSHYVHRRMEVHNERVAKSLLMQKEFNPVEFKQARGKMPYDKAALLKQFRANLQMFIDICRARGIRPVLMTQESRYLTHPDPIIKMKNLEVDRGITYDEFLDFYLSFNQAIREVGERNNVKVIDLAKKIPPSNKYIYDAVHFNNAGSRLAAQIISQELQPLFQLTR